MIKWYKNMPLLMTSKRREKIQTTDLTIQKVEKKRKNLEKNTVLFQEKFYATKILRLPS